MTNFVVYEITIGKGKQIGSTCRINARMREHLRLLIQNKHENSKMQNAYNKYLSFEYRILSYHTTREEAYKEEQFLLNEIFNKKGYLNLNKNATAPPVFFGNQNTSRNPNTIEKIKQTKLKNGSFRITEETKLKISKSNTGRKQSIEEVLKRNEKLSALRITDIYKSNHKQGCLNAQKTRSEESKLNSTRLFRENNPSYRLQTCKVCNKNIKGASAYKRFHGENCKAKLKL